MAQTTVFEKSKEATEALLDLVQQQEKQREEGGDDGFQPVSKNSNEDDDKKNNKKKNKNKNKNKKQSTTLLLFDYADEEHTTPLQPFDLVVSTKKFVANQKNLRPVQISLPNKFWGKAASDSLQPSICVIARDLAGTDSDSSEFYNEKIVEATKSTESALEILREEEKKIGSTSTTKKGGNNSNGKKSSKSNTTDNTIPLEELAKITVDKVVTFSQLRNEYKPYQARRKLISEHDIFFVDRALADMDDGLLLPRIMGKSFFSTTKTVPQPISLTTTAIDDSEEPKTVHLNVRNKDGDNTKSNTTTTNNNNGKGSTSTKDKEAIVITSADQDNIKSSFSLLNTLSGIYKRLHGTHFMVSPGNQVIVRVGSTALTPVEVAENVDTVINSLVEGKKTSSPFIKFSLEKGWDSIRGIFLKTSVGPSLPIFLSDTLFQDESKDVVADESELVNGSALVAATTTTGTPIGKNPVALAGKKRRLRETQISDSRIDELLDEVADEDHLAAIRASKRKMLTNNNNKKKETNGTIKNEENNNNTNKNNTNNSNNSDSSKSTTEEIKSEGKEKKNGQLKTAKSVASVLTNSTTTAANNKLQQQQKKKKKVSIGGSSKKN